MKTENKKTILVTGATGTIGKALCKQLISNGHIVHALSRKAIESGNIKYFQWNPATKYIDINAFENVNIVIHLAGDGIVDKPWTVDRKKVLIESRVATAQLIYDTLKSNHIKIDKFISASGVGYYGTHVNRIFTEKDDAGKDFLAQCCVEWERAAHLFSDTSDVSILRLGIVLDSHGGAFPKLVMPIKLFAGGYIGNGEQAFPWIHIDDVVSIFTKAVEQNMLGVFNLVADDTSTNKSFTKAVAKAFHRPFIPIGVPAFLLNLIMGERSEAILNGQFVSNKKLVETDVVLKYYSLEKALLSLLKSANDHTK